MAGLIGKFKHGDATAVRKKKYAEGTLKYSLFKQAKDYIESGKPPKEAVKLPQGENLDDWIALHVVDFSHRVQLLNAIVSEVCTDVSCPVMSGGPKYEYLWEDGAQYKKPTALSARKYIDCLMDWIEAQIDDETIFAPNFNTEFPKNFKKTCSKILRRLYRVFVHIYIHHFDRIREMTDLNAEAHANTLFKHFYYFVKEFNLVDDKEFDPLKELIAKLCQD